MSLLAELVMRHARKAELLDVLVDAPLVVGVSGGADSLALLSVLREVRGARAAETLHVAHLDHGFRGDESAADARFVAEVARRWGLAISVTYFDVPAYAASRKLSGEDAARRARYAFLGRVAHERGSVVAVGHNADDQAETVLMHLLRGTGIGGLAGMRMLSELPVPPGEPGLSDLAGEATPSQVRVFRPLLGVWRREIEAHCQEEGLRPRQDATNSDPAYRRNYIRHKALPSLEEASPHVKHHLVRLAGIAAAEDDVLEDVTTQAWDTLGIEVEDGHRISLPIGSMADLPLGVARRVVRRMLRTVAANPDGIDLYHIEAALQVLSGAPDGPGAVDLAGGVRVRRSASRGIVERSDERAPAQVLKGGDHRPLMLPQTAMPLDLSSASSLPNGWQVATQAQHADEPLPTPGEYVALFDLDALPEHGGLVLRTWVPGDAIRPIGMRGRKKLQDVLVDAKIPREIRAYLPVVALPGEGGEVLWVPGPGGRRSSTAPLIEQTRRVLRIEFKPPHQARQEATGSA